MKRSINDVPTACRLRQGRSCMASTVHEKEYSADEVEFLRAIDRYKRENRRPFPTWVEVLDVLKGLGWRKTHAEPERTGEGARDAAEAATK